MPDPTIRHPPSDISPPDNAPLRLLVAGDLHLGRASSRLPDDADATDHTTRAAWERLVRTAIDQHADLLFITGDLTESAEFYWATIGPLQAGIRTLADHDIQTFAVAGNHDYDVLPRLADQLADDPDTADHFTLLGRDGTWESRDLTIRGQTLRLIGWSFPDRYVRQSPLDTFPAISTPATGPTLALVHGDLDDPDSSYAPLSAPRLLAQTGVDAWLLGHIHAPRLTDANQTTTPSFKPAAAEGCGADIPGHPTLNTPYILYPGSPQAMDPGESGPHGAWLLEAAPAGLPAPRPVPLSTVRYHPLTLDLTGIADEPAFQAHATRALNAALAELADQRDPALGLVAVRLTLTGTTPLCHHAADLARRLAEDLDLSRGRLSLYVEKVITHARPDLDLPQLARGADAPAALARLLLELEDDDRDDQTASLTEPAAELLRDAHRRIDAVRAGSDYLQLNDAPPNTDPAARALLRDQARALLSQLLTQSPQNPPE